MNHWCATWSEGVEVKNKGEGCYFDFPSSGHINYLTRASGVAGDFIRATIKIEGKKPVFESLDTTGSMPPQCRFYFQKKGDDMRSDGGRWWSNPVNIVLAPGEFVLRVRLKPNQWQGIYGKMANSNLEQKQLFGKAKANMDNFGLTFGGGNSFGHGVRLKKGSARFIINQFEFIDI